MMDKFLWQQMQVVMFDVDGTLYQQSKLRKIMFFKLVAHYLIRPWNYHDVLILYHFRKEREKRAGYSSLNLQEEQYLWCAEKSGQKLEKVKKVVNKWIFNLPNNYLKKCMYPGVEQFFEDLKKHGIKTAIYSDYTSAEKLKQMRLQVDMEISSTDKIVNSFKPLPNGLLAILSELKVTDKKNCLYIGDRFELDGLCAAQAGVPFLLVNKKDAAIDFYTKLSAQLNQ